MLYASLPARARSTPLLPVATAILRTDPRNKAEHSKNRIDSAKGKLELLRTLEFLMKHQDSAQALLDVDADDMESPVNTLNLLMSDLELLTALLITVLKRGSDETIVDLPNDGWEKDVLGKRVLKDKEFMESVSGPKTRAVIGRMVYNWLDTVDAILQVDDSLSDDICGLEGMMSLLQVRPNGPRHVCIALSEPMTSPVRLESERRFAQPPCAAALTLSTAASACSLDFA